MRGSERPPPHEAQMSRCLTRYRPDFGGNGRFLPSHRREDARYGLCHRAFPRARGTDENQVVSAPTCYFHASLRAFLSQDVGKVHVFGRNGPLPLLTEGRPVAFRVPDQQVRGIFLLFQDAEHVVQRPDAEHQGLLEIHGLQSRPFRKDGTPESVCDGKLHHRQGPRHIADASVQPQFAHDEVLLQPGQGPLLRGGDDSQGDGQVIPASLLVQIGRCQIDHNLLPRNPEPLRLQGSHRP